MNTILRDTNLLDDRLQSLVKHILQDCTYHQLPFEVFETGRTLERQHILLANGVSSTLNSKHLIDYNNGKLIKKSTAIDLVLRYPYSGKLTWSWANIGDKLQRDRDMAYYKMLSVMVTTRYPEILSKLKINSVISGGTWTSLRDWPHFELG